MPNYELIYFDVKALAEPIRWIFKLSGTAFKDTRVAWPVETGPDFPLGQVPVLRVDNDLTLTQSYAIGRYLARTFGFVTDDPFLEYRSEEVSAIIEDCRLMCRELPSEMTGRNDPHKLQEIREKLLNKVLPKHLNAVEKILEETRERSKEKGDFIAGKQITHGDFVLASWTNIWEDLIDGNLLERYPLVKRLQTAVLELPEIKGWVKTRPVTFV